MEFDQFKLFESKDNKNLESIKTEGADYYSFIRSKLGEGYSQIVISSGIMLKVLESMFIQKKAKIVEIDFIEDDIQYSEQMDNFISSVNEDRGNFYELMKELSFLSEQESVEIKSIRIKYRENNEPIDIKLSVNGLITAGVNDVLESELSFMMKVIWEKFKS